MDEENFDMRELFKEVIAQMEEIENINEVLKVRDTEIEAIKDSFKETWDNYLSIRDSRTSYLKKLLFLRIKTFLSFFIESLLNNEKGLIVDDLIKKIKTSSIKIKNQKELLKLIKDALEALEFRMVADCNYNINSLLQLLLDQDETIFKLVAEDIKRVETKFQRINVQSSNKYEDKLDKIEEKIDVYVKTLGLK